MMATLAAAFREHDRIDWLFVWLFAFMLPFDNALCNMVIVVYVIYLFYKLLKTRQLPIVNLDGLKSSIFLPLLFIVQLISIAYSDDKATGLKEVTRFFILGLMPMFLAIINLKDREKDKVLLGFVWANFFALMINFGIAFWKSVHITAGQLNFDSSVLGGQEFWYSITNGGNYFFSIDFSTFYHPTYSSMYVLFSAAILLNFFGLKKFSGRSSKILYAIVLLCFVFGIFLYSARIIMLIAFIVFLVFVLKTLIRGMTVLKLATCVIALVVGGILILTNPRTQVFLNLHNVNNDFRMRAWNASLNVFLNNPVFGVGVGDAEQKLMEEYARLDYQDNLTLKLNPHNQYLEIANQSGLLGLIIFLAAIFIVFIKSRSKDFLKLTFVIALSIVCIVETFISRQAGITFFALFYCLLFIERKGEEAKDQSTKSVDDISAIDTKGSLAGD